MSSAPPAASGVPTVVIATRDRRPRLLETLARLAALPERPPVIVVDNASRDGTADAVEQAFPQVTVLRLARDLGPAARTRGIAAAATPLVALTDDDSWWAAGALRRTAPVFDAHPRLGLLAARILVEPGGRLDATWPLPAGSSLYVDDVVAHHAPAPGPRAWIGAREHRNRLWSIWLRRPLPRAARLTVAGLAGGGAPRWHGLAAALAGLVWVSRERRAIPAAVEGQLRLLEGAAGATGAPWRRAAARPDRAGGRRPRRPRRRRSRPS